MNGAMIETAQFREHHTFITNAKRLLIQFYYNHWSTLAKVLKALAIFNYFNYSFNVQWLNEVLF